MARDYAKKTTTRKPKKTVPGWVWLLTGLLVGLFAAFLVYIKGPHRPAAHSARVITAPAPKPHHDARDVKKPTAESAPKAPKPKYDFYTILPEYKVAIPDDEGKASAGDKKSTPIRQVAPGHYLLQVGSFKRAKEAEARKAQLALLGIVSSVQSVTLADGEVWHRVRIGPIDSSERLDQVRELLKRNGINYVLSRQKS